MYLLKVFNKLKGCTMSDWKEVSRNLLNTFSAF